MEDSEQELGKYIAIAFTTAVGFRLLNYETTPSRLLMVSAFAVVEEYIITNWKQIYGMLAN